MIMRVLQQHTLLSQRLFLHSGMLTVNPLIPKIDLHLISPYNITPASSIEVTKIKEIITD